MLRNPIHVMKSHTVLSLYRNESNSSLKHKLPTNEIKNDMSTQIQPTIIYLQEKNMNSPELHNDCIAMQRYKHIDTIL